MRMQLYHSYSYSAYLQRARMRACERALVGRTIALALAEAKATQCTVELL